MAIRALFLGLSAWCVTLFAGSFFDVPNPSLAQLSQAWPYRQAPDAADLLVNSLTDPSVPSSAQLTRKVIGLLPTNPEPMRQYILVRLLELKGDRDASVQPVLNKILQNGQFTYPKQALINAILLTSTDGNFLALALQDPDELFLDAATEKRVMGDPRWEETPALFEACVDGNSPPRDFVDAKGRLDGAAIDDLERRNQCLWAMGKFPSPGTVDRIAGVIDRYRPLLGSNATRALRTILASALEAHDSAVVERADGVLLNALRSSESDSTLRINAVMGLSVAGNTPAVAPIEAQLAVETDPDVAKFLRQALAIIQGDLK